MNLSICLLWKIPPLFSNLSLKHLPFTAPALCIALSRSGSVDAQDPASAPTYGEETAALRLPASATPPAHSNPHEHSCWHCELDSQQLACNHVPCQGKNLVLFRASEACVIKSLQSSESCEVQSLHLKSRVHRKPGVQHKVTLYL